MSAAEVKHTVLEILESIEVNAGHSHPQKHLGLSRGQAIVLGLLATSRSLLRGIYFLAREDHSEEARILSRTLLDDATKLMHFWLHRDSLEDLALRFEYGSMEEERKLITNALRYEPDLFSEDELASIEAERNQLRAEAEKKDVPLKPLPHLEQMLIEMNLGKFYITFRYAGHSVHTSRLALATRLSDKDEGLADLTFGVPAGGAVGIAIQSAEIFVHGHVAATRILGWATAAEVETFTLDVLEKLRHVREALGSP